MPRPHSSNREKEIQIAKVAELWARGLSQAAIGEKVGISVSEVKRDVARLKAQWLASLADHDAIRMQQLAELGQMKREAWDAWDASKRERQELTIQSQSRNERIVGITSNRVFSEHPTGDPRYMGILLSAIDAQNKLLGLIVIKHANTNTDGVDVAPPSTESERLERILTLIGRERDRGARLPDQLQDTAADVGADSGAADDGAVE